MAGVARGLIFALEQNKPKAQMQNTYNRERWLYSWIAHVASLLVDSGQPSESKFVPQSFQRHRGRYVASIIQ